MKRVRGWSVSLRDAAAATGMFAGLLTAVFAGRSVGGWVLEQSGSLWLGTCAWLGTLLVGAILFLGGFAWLLTEPRSYRAGEHPAPIDERVGSK